MLILLAGVGVTMAQVPQLLNYQGRIAVNGTNFSGTALFGFALVDGGSNLTQTATGAATVDHGFLVAVAVTDGGSGYTAPPTVSATGGGGSGASFTAQIFGGVVTNVIVNSAGNDYTGSPTITFSSPPTNLVAQTYWSNDGTSSSGGHPLSSVPLTVTKGLYSVLLGDTTLPNMTALPVSIFTNPVVQLRVWFSDGTNGFQQLTPDQRLAAIAYAIIAGMAQTVADGSITASKIAPGAVGSSQLAPNLTVPGTLTVSNLIINGSALNGSANFQLPGSTNIQTYAGFDYFITNAPANIILPTTAHVGDTVHVRLANGGGNFVYNIQQSAGQQIVTWNNVGGPASAITCSADGTRIAIMQGNEHGFYLSTNSGLSWTPQLTLQSFPNPYFNNSILISSDGSHNFASTSFSTVQGIIVSPDGGHSWFANTNFPSTIHAIACSTNGSKLVAGTWPWGGGGIFTSSDSGSNWTQQAGLLTNIFWASVASSADGSKFVAVGGANGSGGGIYTSGDSGLTWTLQTSAPTNAFWTSVASSADGTKLIAANEWNNNIGGIYVSYNSGVTWSLQSNIPTNAYWSSVALSSDGAKLIATANHTQNGYNGSGIYTSINSGSIWVTQTNGLSNASGCNYIASSADASKLIGYFNDGNFYSSSNFGYTWLPVATFPQLPIQILTAVSSFGAAGGASFSTLSNNELTLVYLGNGMFAIGDANSLNGY